MNARECLRLYNRLTARFCDGLRVFPRKVTTNALAQCEGFLKFCDSNSIDPDRFIRARHDATGWRFRVSLARLYQVQPGFLAKFREFGDDKQASTQLAEKLATTVVEDTDRRSTLTVLSESAKAEFAATPEVCLASHDITLGWHPQSVWCRACALAVDCRTALPLQIRKVRHAGG